VLDADTIALIFLNEITVWNDQRLRNINPPDVAAALPAQPIVVVTLAIGNAVTQLLSSALNATRTEWASRVHSPLHPCARTSILTQSPSIVHQVGVGAAVKFPVESAGNRSVQTSSLNDFTTLLAARPYSFGFWQSYEVYQVRLRIHREPSFTE
jgi:ABC-type phosphate transport system substrate-binding protein